MPGETEAGATLSRLLSPASGYQLNSAECVDIRLKRVVPDHYCHYYPENVKPKPKLRECSMDPCPSR